jgi:hypothetical protein
MRTYKEPTPAVAVSIAWHDDEEGLAWHEVIGLGESDENNPDDEDIFYYVADMAELETLRDPNNGNAWHIVDVDYEDISPL